MGFLLQYTEIVILHSEDISENITQCNLHSHDRFSPARSQIETAIYDTPSLYIAKSLIFIIFDHHFSVC